MFEITPSIAKLKITRIQELAKCKDCSYGKDCKLPRKDYCETAVRIEKLQKTTQK